MMNLHLSRVRLLIALLIISTLSGCAQVTATSQPSTSIPSPASILPATELPSPISTINLSQNAQIKERCPNILPAPSNLSENKAEGVVVLLENRYLDDIRDAFLVDLVTQQTIEFSQEGESLSYYSIAVSPDRKTLAYRVVTPMEETIKLILSNSMGERQKSILLQSEILYPMYGNIGGNWLNDQQLMLDGDVFNPFTGERQSFNPEDFPDIAHDDFGVYSLQFDPELTRAIYSHSNATTVMADLATNQILAEISGPDAGMPKIAWSPHGNVVAIVGTSQLRDGGSEIFLVNRNGKQIKQVTRLSRYYPSFVLFNLAWSPNGRYIAFWQNNNDSKANGLRLFVLDIEVEELTSYCTWGEPTDVIFFGPIWSPDGKHLLVGDLSNKDKIRAVIIDIDKNVAFPIADNMIPVGWMVAP